MGVCEAPNRGEMAQLGPEADSEAGALAGALARQLLEPLA